MKKKTARRLIWFCLLLIALTAFSFWYAAKQIEKKDATQKTLDDVIVLTGLNPLKPTTVRADFMMYVEGKEVIFTDDSLVDKNPFVNLQAGESDINVINAKAEGVTIQQFFKTISIGLSRNCITIPDTQFCSDPAKGKTLKYYVNGQPNADAPEYVIQDGDRILISYGSESYQGIQKQLDTVGERAKPAIE